MKEIRALLATIDEAGALEVLEALEGSSISVRRIGKEDLASALRREDADVIVVEVEPDGRRIPALLDLVRGREGHAGLVLLGDPPEPRTALHAIRGGARDYVVRPLERAELIEAIRAASHRKTTLRRVLELSEEVHQANRKLSRQAILLSDEQQRLERRNGELNLIHEVSVKLTGTLEVGRLLEALDGGLRRLLPLDWSLVAIEKGERPVRLLATGGNKLLEERLRSVVIENASKLFAAPLGPAEMELAWCGSGAASPGSDPVSLPSSVEGALTAREMVYPIGSEGDRSGLLAFGWTNGPIGGRLERVVSTLARQAALALANARSLDIANERSRRDPLTALYNRAELAEAITRELDRSRRYREPVSLLLIDVDHFKSINDRFGHLQGDTVLRNIADSIAGAARQSDLVARYGGEEFAVLMPHTDPRAAVTLAERIRGSVGVSMSGIPVTVSIGVAGFPGGSDGTPEDLFYLADEALYGAKHAGRNRTVLGGHGGGSRRQAATLRH